MKDIMTRGSPEELLQYMSAIQYSWIDQKGVEHIDPTADMYHAYRLQSPVEVMESLKGICVDQVELERAWFSSHNYEFKTYCIEYYQGDYNPGHVFLIYKRNSKWIWFENSWRDERGLKEYTKKASLLDSVRSKFIIQNNITNAENLHIFAYDKLNPHINYEQMDKAIMPPDLYDRYRRGTGIN